ncbi:MAG TPA: UDP-3-O-(3-hydroxymyristoyl)glucosamine N-acyltransferase [Micavibrio sp.]|jgi:UDP-3-O-[3-hydroxymyristoyl] glucosamine N-acyltransferase
MADPRFFQRSGPFTLGVLAGMVKAEIGRGSPDIVLEDVAPLDQAGAGHLSFLDNIRYRDAFRSSKACACIVSPDMVELAPDGMALLVTKAPYKSYALAAQLFYPDHWPEARIAESARLHPSVKTGKGCVIEEGAVIAEGAELGDGCWIEANAVIGRNVVLGPRCRVGAGATLSHCQVGQATRFYPGARIGQDGFGFAIDPAGHVKVPQLGRVIVGDHVEVGANTTIDRGAGPDTIIGDGAWIDNLVQIGHNVKIGRGCIIIAQVGISGSAVLEDYAVLAGQAGVAGHLTIGKGARIAAQSGIMKDVPAGAEMMGYPALPIRQFMRQVATLNRLIQKKEKPS